MRCAGSPWSHIAPLPSLQQSRPKFILDRFQRVVKNGFEEMGASDGNDRESGFQSVANCHNLTNLGNDAALLS